VSSISGSESVDGGLDGVDSVVSEDGFGDSGIETGVVVSVDSSACPGMLGVEWEEKRRWMSRKEKVRALRKDLRRLDRSLVMSDGKGEDVAALTPGD